MERAVPLIVDVDGTLLRTDILHESMLAFVAAHPWQVHNLFLWTMQGKAVLKSRLADVVDPSIETMPLRQEIVDLIRAAQAEGRPVYVASASDRRHVERLAQRIGGIAGVFGTDGGTNLAGQAKAARLVETFGKGGYDYVGDMPVDLPVWQDARAVLAVAHSPSFESQVKRSHPDATIVARPQPPARAYLRALRVHQWAKNVLLFLSLIAGHHFDWGTIAATFLAFASFCMAASGAYVLNDLLDIPGDREHPTKSRRPFAAGDLPVSHGVAMGTVLIAGSLLVSLMLPDRFVAILALYVLITFAYSMKLKRVMMLDVITLGGLYTIRVIAGLAAATQETSQWLLMFSLFLFLSLAIAKRCSELIQRGNAGKKDVPGRNYRVEDLQILFPLAAAAGYGAILVVTLYLSSDEVRALYRQPERLWLLCPLLLYWVSRILMIVNRGELRDDPVLFTVTDRTSWLTGACVAAVIWFSV